jgi:monoamine oxidase
LVSSSVFSQVKPMMLHHASSLEVQDRKKLFKASVPKSESSSSRHLITHITGVLLQHGRPRGRLGVLHRLGLLQSRTETEKRTTVGMSETCFLGKEELIKAKHH